MTDAPVEALRASLIVWEWSCDECQLMACGTFEEFGISGWVERASMATGKVEKFCPRCTRGWKLVGSIMTTEERRAEEEARGREEDDAANSEAR